MRSVSISIVCVVTFLLAPIISVIAGEQEAKLQRHVPHEPTASEQQACTSDAFRLCSSEMPDAGKVKLCMVRHKQELSPPCKLAFW